MTTTVTRHRAHLYARDFVLGALIAVALVAVGAAGTAAGRVAAVHAAPHPTSIIQDSGWERHHVTMRRTHGCEFNGRYALCRTVREWVRRYGHQGGLIYNSGHTLHITWRYFSGRTKWCMKCLLQVRETNWYHTLRFDPTWDFDHNIRNDGWSSCTVAEHPFGDGCSTAWRQTTNDFVNHYVLAPLPLDRHEQAGVKTHVWLSTTASVHEKRHGLRLSTSYGCC